MMKKSIIIMSSLLLVALVAGSVFAWGGPCKGNRGAGSGFNQNCQRYGGQDALNDLSQEQRDEIKALHQKFIDDTYPVRSEMFQKHQEIKMLMETSNPDRTKLLDLSDELTDLQKQMRAKQIDLQLAAKKIAPELNMGMGFGKGHGKWSGKGKCRGGQGQGPGQGQQSGKAPGQGCGRYNN
ncbi:periplasmic heavy metal sensor [Desulfobacula sp.]|uniref:Spy/CpxP family protein refolding chaperone n=1 Tax=Desulfobacula sp. TaxID=2593537 RepID=UPI00262D49C2|nr:periplasmic heavy metal sensor [Desulfobacula sp.]